MKHQNLHRHHFASKRTALSLAISQLVLGTAISLPAYAQDKQLKALTAKVWNKLLI
jgi:hypothetical protein